MSIGADSLTSAAERERHARSYLLVVRPALITAAVAITALDEWIDPETVSRAVWIGMALFVLAQFAYMAAYHFGPWRAVTVTAASLAVDSILMLETLWDAGSPASGAASYVILIVAMAYFSTPRVTIAYASFVAIMIAILGPQMPYWSDPAPVPASAFAVFVSGVLIAILSAQKRRSEARIDSLVIAQQRSLERLRRVDAARDRLIANVSHELRTPLTSTIGFIETLLRDDVTLSPADRQQLLVHARDGGRRLLVLVEDLLAIGATRPDAIRIDAEEVSLGDLINNARNAVDAELTADPIVRGDTDASVVVDRRRIEQVLTNLLTNALRHGAPPIEIECGSTSTHVWIDVIDSGDGIDERHVEDLFQPFATFSARSDSTGLGLAICKAVMDAHQGDLTYGRDEAQRTRFRLELPRER